MPVPTAFGTGPTAAPLAAVGAGAAACFGGTAAVSSHPRDSLLDFPPSPLKTASASDEAKIPTAPPKAFGAAPFGPLPVAPFFDFWDFV